MGAGPSPVNAETIALSIDGGHVRSIRDYQVRSFEVLPTQVTNHEGKQIVFSRVPAEAISQQAELRGVFHTLGAAGVTPVTVISDGAEGPRALGEAASPGPTSQVLGWFHLSKRIQHVDRAVKSWPDATADDRQTGAGLVETIDRIRWRPWHGQAACALDLIGETLVTLDGAANGEGAGAVAARKAARLLRDLEKYICGQSDIIIDDATARLEDESISTAVMESTVQCPLHRRMNAQQPMRWSSRGAHLMLKVRIAAANGTREHPQVLDGLIWPETSWRGDWAWSVRGSRRGRGPAARDPHR